MSERIITLFLSLGILLAISHMILDIPLVYSGLSIFIAFLLSYNSLAPMMKKQVSYLTTLGIIGLIISYIIDSRNIDLSRYITVNLPLIVILLSSGMLKLICIPSENPKQSKGSKGILQSLVSTHLFSSVIHISAVYMAGDFLQRSQILNTIHSRILTRPFVLAMLWSPMMGGMAIGLTWSPNASIELLILHGLPLALIGLLITLYEIKFDSKDKLKNFQGISISISDMKIPISLTFFVLIVNYIFPIPSIPILVSCSIIAFVIIIQTYRTKYKAIKEIGTHAYQQLPSMRNELSLFLSIGIFAQGLNDILNIFFLNDIQLVIEWYHMIMILLFVFITSYFGLHPLASVSIIGSLAQNLDFHPNLMAFTLIASWSLGSLANPYSGITMVMTQRFSIPKKDIESSNKFYLLITLVVYITYMTIIGLTN